MRFLILLALFTLTSSALSQSLPYHEIPEPPKDFSANSILSRTIDGLGYRYYWASESLRPEDLDYKASEEGRTSRQTLEHIHRLVQITLNTVKNEPTIGTQDLSEYSFEKMRTETLHMIKEASDLCRNGDLSVENMNVRFKNGDSENSFPIWNLLNGPLADALWHTGQVVMLRRASGNPLHSGVSVFMGKTSE